MTCQLHTSVYRKDIHYACCSTRTILESKLGVVITLFHRAQHMYRCSNEDARVNKHKHLKSALGACGYNDWTFEKALHKSKLRPQSKPLLKSRSNDTIPSSHTSVLFGKNQKIFRKHQIPVSFKPTNTLRLKLVHHKDKPLKVKQSNIVLRICIYISLTLTVYFLNSANTRHGLCCE